MTRSTPRPVCVTGASGFIASHIVAQFLDAGERVIGTVRGEPDDYPHLASLPGADNRLDLVRADLTEPRAFDEAFTACRAVIHTASPYTLDVADPARDLVEPAVEGTRNVLNAARRAESIGRVVFTSSVAAMTDEPNPDHVYTEADWNDRSSLRRNPYYYSKLMAERGAWDFMKKGAHGAFDLVVINPFLVIGPSMIAALNTSSRVFADLLNGEYPGIMDFAWGMVDVRDVASAHLRALEIDAAHGRYLCAADTVTMRHLIDLFRENGYRGYKLPKLNLTGPVGSAVVKLASWLRPKGTGSYLRTHVGRVPRFDNGKIKRDLGLEFRPIDESILETLESLERWGHIPPRPSPTPSGPS